MGVRSGYGLWFLVLVPLSITSGAKADALLEVQAYAEKDSYLVGEPIFIILEIENAGSEPVRIENSAVGLPRLNRYVFEIPGAKQVRRTGVWGCWAGFGGSGGVGIARLQPGERHVDRVLLNRHYDLAYPGDYDVALRAVVRWMPGTEDYTTFRDTPEFAFDFRIHVEFGEEEELQEVFAPLVKKLNEAESEETRLARQAVTELAPPFLEPLLISLARDPRTRGADTVGALGNLGTGTAKKVLAEIIEETGAAGRYEWIREHAIATLAVTRDADYLPVLVRVLEEPSDDYKTVTIRAMGLLGGNEAVARLVTLMRHSNEEFRHAAIWGLGNTSSRQAVPHLILLLLGPDYSLRQTALVALAQLTHRKASEQAWRDYLRHDLGLRWLKWWLVHGPTAKIYGPDECAEPQLFE